MKKEEMISKVGVISISLMALTLGILCQSMKAITKVEPTKVEEFNPEKDLKNVINCFAEENKDYKKTSILPQVKLIKLEDKKGKLYKFFGVHENDQKKVNFDEFRKMVIKSMTGQDAKRFTAIQIIGDSAAGFSEKGTDYARRFLMPFMENMNNIIEYGYTGNSWRGQKELDTNAFVNEYLDKRPRQAYRILANAVGHAYIAITEWGNYVSPQVKNFVIVYNDAGMDVEPQFDEHGNQIAGYTVFGSDITMSDYFLSERTNGKLTGDKLICLEGGAQSFLQVVNCLERGVKVELIYNIRKPVTGPERFSTARLLKKIQDAHTARKMQAPGRVFRGLTKDEVRTIINDYRASILPVKKGLFEAKIEEFIEKEIYRKIMIQCKFLP